MGYVETRQLKLHSLEDDLSATSLTPCALAKRDLLRCILPAQREKLRAGVFLLIKEGLYQMQYTDIQGGG